VNAWIVTHYPYSAGMREVTVDHIEGEKVYFIGSKHPARRGTKHCTYFTDINKARALLRMKLEELITYHTERAQDLENQLCNMK
jgi:hypothetical protein